MKYYAGLDVSLKEISICVVDQDGDDGTFDELTRDDIVLWHAATFTSAPDPH